MSFQEKRSLVYLISTIVVTADYFAYMVQRYPEADPYSPTIFKFWGTFFLILIPVSIISKIVFHVILSIVNTITTQEEEPTFADELDKLIELKATRNSLYVFSMGFVVGMVALVMEYPPATMFVIFIVSGAVSEVVSEFSQLYYYRRGV